MKKIDMSLKDDPTWTNRNRKFDIVLLKIPMNCKTTCYFDDGQIDELIMTKMMTFEMLVLEIHCN